MCVGVCVCVWGTSEIPRSVLEDAQACTCCGSIWAVASAADIPIVLCWHGTIAGSGISKKLLLLGLAAAGGQIHRTVALGPCGS